MGMECGKRLRLSLPRQDGVISQMFPHIPTFSHIFEWGGVVGFPTNGGRGGLHDLSLERFGTQVVQRRVPSLTVIERLNPFKQTAAGLVGVGITSLTHQFRLQRTEKAL